jgi:DnaJ-class molecular chaperone
MGGAMRCIICRGRGQFKYYKNNRYLYTNCDKCNGSGVEPEPGGFERKGKPNAIRKTDHPGSQTKDR